MIHLILLSYAITVVLGTANAVYTFNAYKALKYNYLRYFYFYTLIFLALIFSGQIFEYIYINIMGGKFTDITPAILFSWEFLLAVGEAAMLVSIGLTMFEMKELKIKKKFKIIAGVLIALFLAAYILIFLINVAGLNNKWFIYSLIILSYVRDFAIILFVFWLLFNKKNGAAIKSRQIFGGFFLIKYILYFVIAKSFNFYAGYYINSILLLPISVFPYIWIKYFLLKEKCENEFNYNSNLPEKLEKDFNITPREYDIISLILKGKSNKEILSDLNISHSTVKNHLYSIYQKMNINSRLQLVSLILEKGNGGSGNHL